MKFMDSTKTCLLFLILALVDVKYLLSGLGYWLSSSLTQIISRWQLNAYAKYA